MSEVYQTQSLEWINSNMHRNYPLADGVVPKAVSEEYLPASFMVDLQLIVPYVEGLDASRFFIHSIIRQPSALQITIGYMIDTATGTGFDCAISSSIPLGIDFADTSNPYPVQLAGITTVVPEVPGGSYTNGVPAAYKAMRGIRGTVYIGSCVDMASIGELVFLYNNARLIPQCIYIESPDTRISSVRFIDDNNTDTTFTDDITIRATEGILIDIEGQTVTLKLDDDYVQNEINNQISERYGNAIKTINGIGPDDTGNFTLQGADCTIITRQAAGLSISNPCAKPCCDAGGVDSAEIKSALQDLQSAKEVLNNYYTDLATKVNSMQARLSSLIASRG